MDERSRDSASYLPFRPSYSFWSHLFARARSPGDEPPVISPALLMSAPSRVTTLYRSEPEWYASWRASSRPSHTIASPTAYSTALRKRTSAEITSRTGFLLPPSCRSRSEMGLVRMVSSGTNVSGAPFFSFRYLMHSMTVASSSTTIASMFLPIAMVTAALYLRWDGLHTSSMRPCTPGKRRTRFSSISADSCSRFDSRWSIFDLWS